jgi:hypothetical protein
MDGGNKCTGIICVVLYDNSYEHKGKIALCDGFDEETDILHTAQWGSGLPKSVAELIITKIGGPCDIHF